MILTANCPHCSADRIALSVHAVVPGKTPYRAQLFVCCPACDAASVFVVSGRHERLSNAILQHTGKTIDLRNPSNGLIESIIQKHPDDLEFRADTRWPKAIQKPFVDAQAMLAAKMTPALVISACRSVLDVTLKDLGADGRNMFERIDDLAAKGVITGVLRDWAHRLRDSGNDAVHDLENGPPGHANELVQFTKLLLHIAYELPATIPVSLTPE